MAATDLDLSESDLWRQVPQHHRPLPTSRTDIYFPRLPELRVQRAVIRVCRETWTPGCCIRRERRDNHLLFCVLSGSARFLGDEGLVDVGPGWVVGVSPEARHALWTSTGEMHGIRLVAVGTRLRRAFQQRLGGQCVARAMQHPDEVQSLFQWLVTTCARGADQGLADSAWDLLLHAIDRNRRIDRPPSRAERSYLTARGIIEREFDRPLCISEVASRCGISSEHLARLFLRYHGEGPQKMLFRLRMNKAAHLLIDTDLPVAEVADTIGYSDAFAFSKAFRRCFGRSPRSYRERA
ncbi:MAG: helix-turn-helix transcriptional regulator [Planctomycetota bacterium]